MYILENHTKNWLYDVDYISKYLQIKNTTERKMWIAFQEPYKRDYILQKRPIIVRSLLNIAKYIQIKNTTEINLDNFSIFYVIYFH